MTWNVQNLLPVGHPDGPENDKGYEAKLAGPRRANRVGPDVLPLQEVGATDVLADLDAACTTDLGNRAVGSPDDRDIRVALLSSRQLANRTDTRAFPVGVLPVQARDVAFDASGSPS